MTPTERKAELKASGITGAAIATRLRISQSVVSETLSGTRNNLRAKRAIARAIGRPLDDVFPETNRRATDAVAGAA